MSGNKAKISQQSNEEEIKKIKESMPGAIKEYSQKVPDLKTGILINEFILGFTNALGQEFKHDKSAIEHTTNATIKLIENGFFELCDPTEYLGGTKLKSRIKLKQIFQKL